MYQIGQQVVCGGSGVCTVAQIGPRETGGRLYYTLIPRYGTETIYAPVDGKVFLRPILTRKEAEALIAAIPTIPPAPVEGNNSQLRTQYYRAALRSHSCGDLVRLIKTIYQHSQGRRRSMRPSQLDETYRKRAEDLLNGELAAALELEREQVPRYIRAALEGEAARP